MEQGEGQSAFKSRVKQWLKFHQLDYKWMADQCGVSEITVRNWMSQKNVPVLKEQLMERVMVQLPNHPTTSQQPTVEGVEVQTNVALTIKLSLDVYSALEKKAQQQGILPSELLARTISDLVSQETNKTTLPIRKVILPPQN